jgi:putative protease
MNVVTYIQDMHQLSLAREYGVKEILLGHRELNRFGKLTTKEFLHLAKTAKELGLKTVIEWDILMTEGQFAVKGQMLLELIKDIDSVRVQDPGAMQFVYENTNKPMQLILENGNHNLCGVMNWVSYFAERIEKVVLSIELARDTLKEYCEKLSIPVEFQGLGRILLFYTPRNLLSPLVDLDEDTKKVSNEFIEAVGESEESPHKGFPVIENAHGTFMFHIRHFYLLDFIGDLKEIGLQYLRIDLRFDNNFDQLPQIMDIIQENADGKEFKKVYDHDVIRGFYHVNKSDVLFKKLKNYRIQRKDESYVGEVVDVAKSHHMAIIVKGNAPFKIGDELKFITPEGKELQCKVHFLKNSSGKDLKQAAPGQLVLMNQFKGVWTKSSVYFS